MSLLCPSSPIYRTSAEQKLQSRNAARVYRFGSPKLRDQLREKCRIRVREARQSSYEKSRLASDGACAVAGDNNNTVNLAVSEILRQELAELEKDINLQEEIYKELLGEFNDWFVEQLEEEEAYLIDVGENEELTCPVCQRAALVGGAGAGSFKCSCEASFHFAGDAEQLRLALQSKMDEHDAGRCSAPLAFFVEPQTAVNSGNMLTAMCDICEYFSSL